MKQQIQSQPLLGIGKKNEGFDWLVKVIILGDSNVGKTSIVNQYVNGRYAEEFKSTIGVDMFLKTVEVEERKIKLQIWDTAGQERFRHMSKLFYKGAYGIIYTFSMSDQKSFQNIHQWVRQVQSSIDYQLPSIILGNKNDLPPSMIQVKIQECEELAKQYNINFFAVSAKTDSGIKEAFLDLCKKMKLNLMCNSATKDTTQNQNQVQFKIQQTPQKSCSC